MKTKLGLLSLILISAGVIISSCGTYAYRSVSAKVPMLSKPNDLNAQMNVSNAGGEIYAAYAVLKNLGVSVGGAGFSNQADSNVNSNEPRKLRDFELGLVPFYAKDKFRLEMPLGIGFVHSISGQNTSMQPWYQRTFMQPTAGVHLGAVDLAVFCRITSVNYANVNWGVDTRWEPGFMLRAGSENIKGMFQFRLDNGGNQSRSSGLPLTQQTEYLPWHIGFGIHFNFNFFDEESIKYHD